MMFLHGGLDTMIKHHPNNDKTSFWKTFVLGGVLASNMIKHHFWMMFYHDPPSWCFSNPQKTSSRK
jgi:hypothetical protein